MAFSWSTVAAGDIAKAAQANEVQDNTDVLADNLSIAHYSWSSIPIVSPGVPMKASQMTELQTALDYIDTNNVCSAENSTNYVGDNSNHDSTVLSSRDISAVSAVETSYNNNNDPGYDNDLHTGYNVSVQTTNYNPQYSTVNGARNINIYWTANATA
jgi:hypothetical protein